MDPARREQFARLDDAKRDLLAWAAAAAVPLVRVEFVVPFVETDSSVAVWLFYDTDTDLARCAETGMTARVQQRFLSTLSDHGYPDRWLAEVSFHLDSHENVERHFEGNYFYRLR